ncbi:MAG: carboxylate-amine ligase [Rhizobiales bacterium 65-9]|nr:carboxylate-amine ligase [Hyphomicrobiales bacterium]OJY38116.1 MAG: carboxylate-amine ligase [Rhizobiales bacterium 65-9]
MTTTAMRFGVEEEFFIADKTTCSTPRGSLKTFHAAARQAFPTGVQREMLQSQLEIATPPVSDVNEARAMLSRLRAGLSDVAREHGLALFAAGTHPTAHWTRERATPAARYDKLMRDLRMLGERNLVCGMHVHVEVMDPSTRVDLMNRMQPFLPLLLALSTSSPFWQGRWTGLLGYRLAAYREMPRTGLPETFDDAQDYERYVDAMVAAGAIPDASFIWWALRPSLKHPTLELRIADSCTNVDDAVAIASLYRCMVRLLDRRRDINAAISGAVRAVASENIWRAQRYGMHGTFVDLDRRRAVSAAEWLGDILTLVAEDAEALGCVSEFDRVRAILARGSSADRQLAIFNEARGRGLPQHEALREVVAWLSEATVGRDLLSGEGWASQERAA